MKWTKALSRKAVAAKARKRLERATADWSEPAGPRVRVPRRPRAAVTIQIRDHQAGDSLTLNLVRSPWPNQWLCELGQFSSARLGRTLTLILQSAAAH